MLIIWKQETKLKLYFEVTCAFNIVMQNFKDVYLPRTLLLNESFLWYWSQADKILLNAFIAIKNANFLHIFFVLNTDWFLYHRVVVKQCNTFELLTSSDILNLKIIVNLHSKKIILIYKDVFVNFLALLSTEDWNILLVDCNRILTKHCTSPA